MPRTSVTCPTAFAAAQPYPSEAVVVLVPPHPSLPSIRLEDSTFEANRNDANDQVPSPKSTATRAFSRSAIRGGLVDHVLPLYGLLKEPYDQPVAPLDLRRSSPLDKHAWRTVRLLETFLLRPDLALRVRHLDISAYYCNNLCYERVIPDVLQFDGTNGLSLAKNVRSLTLSELRDWIHMPERTNFRAVVSTMKLTHLKIQGIRDGPIIGDDYRMWNGNFFEGMLGVLQAQPSLESLSLVECKFSPAFLSDLGARLSGSDVPALRNLTAQPEVAAAFLTRISGPESIALAIDEWREPDLIPMSMGDAENRASVRELTFRVSQKRDWTREQVSRFLPLFPNVETLRVVLCSRYHVAWEEPQGVEDCLYVVPSNIHILPSICCLELGYEADHEIPNGWKPVRQEGTVSAFGDDRVIFERLEEFIREIKLVCPQLEMFVDPKRRLWVYLPDSDSSGGGSSAKLMGKLEVEQEGFVKDLPWTKRRPRRTLRNVLGWS
ncbi:hypothetical protein M407DRAFT_29082 [Tulasnella calospora MUT 4182]|uniref:Uncharacterized protein n=1 Tax=Tulasnella calospora MUT 4182 TaxID=1051891 RepID=A0A0C3LIS4_9AGAM|nr:hypothetical protein M407DRAFT_29082 [Tulasnella calospora MUT 4182]